MTVNQFVIAPFGPCLRFLFLFPPFGFSFEVSTWDVFDLFREGCVRVSPLLEPSVRITFELSWFSSWLFLVLTSPSAAFSVGSKLVLSRAIFDVSLRSKTATKKPVMRSSAGRALTQAASV